MMNDDDDATVMIMIIMVKVRFRAGEDWSELAKGRQSGGEMSVTTAVYMLALQVICIFSLHSPVLISGVNEGALSMC